MSVSNSASRWGEVKSYVVESKNQQQKKSEVFTHTKRWTESQGFHQVSNDPKESKQLSQKWHTVIDSTLGFKKPQQQTKMMTQRWNPDSGFRTSSTTPSNSRPNSSYQPITRDRSQSLSIIETPLRREFVDSTLKENKEDEYKEMREVSEEQMKEKTPNASIDEKMSDMGLSENDAETASEKSSTAPSPVIEPKTQVTDTPSSSTTSISTTNSKNTVDNSPRLMRRDTKSNQEFATVQLRTPEKNNSSASAADKKNFRQSVSLHDLGSSQNTSDMCFFCGKRVYLMEKKSLGEKVFHMPCFKCCVCNKAQSLTGGYFFHGENLYCRLHHEILLNSK